MCGGCSVTVAGTWAPDVRRQGGRSHPVPIRLCPAGRRRPPITLPLLGAVLMKTPDAENRSRSALGISARGGPALPPAEWLRRSAVRPQCWWGGPGRWCRSAPQVAQARGGAGELPVAAAEGLAVNHPRGLATWGNAGGALRQRRNAQSVQICRVSSHDLTRLTFDERRERQRAIARLARPAFRHGRREPWPGNPSTNAPSNGLIEPARRPGRRSVRGNF